MEGKLVYATFFKMIKCPRSAKISQRAGLWPRVFYIMLQEKPYRDINLIIVFNQDLKLKDG